MLKRKADLLKDREPTEKRQKLLNDFDTMTKQEKEIDERLKTYRKNDPVVIKEMENSIMTCVEAINRWTDNAFNCKSYMVKKLNMISKDADKTIGITEDFDNIDMPKPIVTTIPKVLEQTSVAQSIPNETPIVENNVENNEDIEDNQPLQKDRESPTAIAIAATS